MYWAQQEAAGQGGKEVGPEHLLLGIVADQDAEVSPILRRLGILPDMVQTRLRPLLPAVTNNGGDAYHLSGSAMHVLEAAYAEANRSDSRTITTVHLLIGVLSESMPQGRSFLPFMRPKRVVSVAVAVLSDLGVTLRRVHRAISEPDILLLSSANMLPVETLVRPVTVTASDESDLLRVSETETGHQE